MTNLMFDQVQENVKQTARHGYAVYAKDIMFAWSMSLHDALELPRATRVVNVQNGGYYELVNGEITAEVWANGTVLLRE
jgi:hypothetical protein